MTVSGYPTGSHASIDHFRRELARLGRALFLSAHDTPFVSWLDEELDDESADFRTRATDGHAIRDALARRLAGDTPTGESPWLAAAIKKRSGGAFADQIGIGRARSVDVSIPLPQLSKYHAYFTSTESGWAIADGKSTNGTFVDGVRLDPLERHVLGERARIRLGPHVFQYFSASAFVDELAKAPLASVFAE